MSHISIVGFKADGSMLEEPIAQIDNAWIGAPVIWKQMEKTYLPFYWPEWADPADYPKGEESFKLIIENETFNEDKSIANGTIKEIGKEIDIPSPTGEFIGVSKVAKNDIPQFNAILEELMDEDKQNYYDFAFKKLK